MKNLSSMEYRFMEFIWEYPEGVMVQEIYDAFPQVLGTKSAILSHIKEKGYITMEMIKGGTKGRQWRYTATIGKEEYDKGVLEQKLLKDSKLDTLDKVIAAICGKKTLTHEQSDRLYRLIDELREEDE